VQKLTTTHRGDVTGFVLAVVAGIAWVVAAEYVVYCATFVFAFSDPGYSRQGYALLSTLVLVGCAVLGARFVWGTSLRRHPRTTGLAGSATLLVLLFAHPLTQVMRPDEWLPTVLGAAIWLVLLAWPAPEIPAQ
jgi:uncharacterized membrane protein (UPF0136 family)